MMKSHKLASPLRRWFDEGFKLVSQLFDLRLKVAPVMTRDEKEVFLHKK
jgi:hypothetical protein